MIIKRAYKYRIYPNSVQKQQLEQTFGCCRFVYNHYLRQRIDCYLVHKTGLNFYDNANDLVFLKKQSDYEWLQEPNSQALQGSLKDLEASYTAFFLGRAKFPNFKKKHQKQSFRIPQHFKINQQSITVPKIGKIRAKIHRPVGDKICNLTISKTPTGKYYAAVQCEVYIENPKFQGNEVGIDLGIADYLVTSDSTRILNPKYLQRSLDKLKWLQQQHSRKEKGSNTREKYRNRIARLYEKISNQRTDFLHKLSLKLVRENQVCYVEDLSVKKLMQESHKNLARNIADAGWGQFLTLLQYKGDWYGCHIVKIQKYFPSSKRCNNCGFINETLTLNQREWQCPECNTMLDRDLNAAKNIKQAGAGTALN